MGWAEEPRVFITSSEVTTAPKLAALARKQTPTPTVAIRTPPMAGPTARAAFTVTEFRVMALRKFVLADHLAHERLPGRVLEGVVEAEYHRQQRTPPRT